MGKKTLKIAAGGFLLYTSIVFLVLLDTLPESILFEGFFSLSLTKLLLLPLLSVLSYGIGDIALRCSIALRQMFRNISVKREWRKAISHPNPVAFDAFILSFPISALMISVGLCFANDFSNESIVKVIQMIGVIPGYTMMFILLSELIDKPKIEETLML